MRAIFLAYGIHHPTPIKGVWLGLIWLSVVMKVILIVRLWRSGGYQFPGLCVFLGTSCLFDALHDTRVWGVSGECLLTVGSLLYVMEAAGGASGTVIHASERRYIRMTAQAVAAMLIGVALMAKPLPYGNYPKLLYYLHLFTIIPCFGSLVYVLGHHFERGTYIQHPFRANVIIGIVWFAVPILATKLNAGVPYTLENYPWGWVIDGQIAQTLGLAAWHLSMIRPVKRPAIALSPRSTRVSVR